MSADYDWIRDLFEAFGPVSVRRMFGGAGIYRDGIIFGILRSDGDIYLKADEETVERFRAAGSREFTHRRGERRFTMPYWTLPDAAIDDPDALREWAELGWSAAKRKAATERATAPKARPRKKKAPAKRAKR